MDFSGMSTMETEGHDHDALDLIDMSEWSDFSSQQHMMHHHHHHQAIHLSHGQNISPLSPMPPGNNKSARRLDITPSHPNPPIYDNSSAISNFTPPDATDTTKFDELFIDTDENGNSMDDSGIHMIPGHSPSGNQGNPMMGYASTSAKKHVIPTITTIYEPKFFEIFLSYQSFIAQFEPNVHAANTNISNQHLMTLCLNNLLTFSNWARDSNNATFIRVTLFENPDMRPEVRNGLAMILVYVCSAAKSNEMRLTAIAAAQSSNANNPSAQAAAINAANNIDMFTVLMKTDSGLGIVNKTSLKIYSDPFGFFNYIKTCISGLIDASAIPENERLNNQQPKRTRRGSKNKDEVEAYEYVKNSLVALFEVPDSLQLAKNRILQILNFWHVKGKSIRNERFSALFSLPLPNNSQTTTSTIEEVLASVNNSNNNSSNVQDSGSKPVNRMSNRSSGGSLPFDSNSFISNMQGSSGGGNNSVPWGENESVYSDSMSSCSPHPSFYDGANTSARSSGVLSSTINTGNNAFLKMAAAANGSGGGLASGMNNLASSSRDEYGMNGVHNNAATAAALNYTINSYDGLRNLQHQLQQSLTLLSNKMNAIPVPCIRFDRISLSNWLGINTFLYDFDELHKSVGGNSPNTPNASNAVASNTGVSGGNNPNNNNNINGMTTTSFHLVDEMKLKQFLLQLYQNKRNQQLQQQQMQQQQQQQMQQQVNSLGGANGNDLEDFDFNTTFRVSLTDQLLNMGLTSFDKILQKSGAIVTTWNPMDYNQLKVFINSWKAQGIQSSVTTSHSGPRSNSGSGIAIDTSMNDSNNMSIPIPPQQPVLSPSNSMINSMETFNIGSSPTDQSGAKRYSKRRTSGSIDMKRDILRALQLQHEAANRATNSSGSNPNNTSGDRSRQPSTKSIDGSSLSPVGSSTASVTGGSHGNSEIRIDFSALNLGNSSSSNTTGTVITPSCSLIEYWYLLRSAQLGVDNSIRSSFGKGILVFERSAEVGLIIRANPKYNLHDDIWCLLYLEDAISYFFESNNRRMNEGLGHLQHSFAAFLMHLLPQTRILLQYLLHEQQQQQQQMNAMRSGGVSATNNFAAFNVLSSGITISYHAHKMGVDSSSLNNANSNSNAFNFMMNNVNNNMNNGPPAALSNSHYRTIGTIDQHFQQILSRFSNDCYFHDITLV